MKRLRYIKLSDIFVLFIEYVADMIGDITIKNPIANNLFIYNKKNFIW